MNVRKGIVIAAGLVVFWGFVAVAQTQAQTEAKVAFEALKGLAGTWQGEGEAHGQKFPWVNEVQVSANGTVVMETMNPGTPHEMINMYHLVGEDLVITHYCSGGNQPTMKLDRAHATASTLPFVFAGGSNLDPAKDSHIHEVKVVLSGADTLESTWIGYHEGKAQEPMIARLSRQSGG